MPGTEMQPLARRHDLRGREFSVREGKDMQRTGVFGMSVCRLVAPSHHQDRFVGGKNADLVRIGVRLKAHILRHRCADRAVRLDRMD